MLFNSPEFILVFLPATLAVFIALKRSGLGHLTMAPLAFASLLFYAWWDPRYLVLLLGSIAVNYSVGRILATTDRRIWLWLGIAANLACLGWFKYADFFISTGNRLLTTDLNLPQVILPLGISFFTFQQIAYLVDSWHRRVDDHNALHYLTFVAFFPQLIAGPIVHHKYMIHQFVDNEHQPYNYQGAALGLTLFALGLFKKVVLADELAGYASPVFAAAGNGASVALLDAWGAALGYTFQLYFDFSGYSDMAIGLGRMFGIRLPINFNSPYKAASIIDFWRRWHMTLSTFLRDYLYIPLGGGRRGVARRYLNLMLTMLLGGLWHGAGWTFVLWGGVHGLYLAINHLWRAWFVPPDSHRRPVRLFRRACAHGLTLLAVIVAWVLFRAEDLDTALLIYQGMFGFNGLVLPSQYLNTLAPVVSGLEWVTFSDSKAIGALRSIRVYNLIALSMVIVWWLPNCAQMLAWHDQLADKRFYSWVPNKGWLTLTVATLSISLYFIIYSSNRVSEFIYFQF